MKRREFIQASATASAAIMAANTVGASQPIPLGKAEHCVMLWLGGGMSQIDTFDLLPVKFFSSSPINP